MVGTDKEIRGDHENSERRYVRLWVWQTTKLGRYVNRQAWWRRCGPTGTVETGRQEEIDGCSIDVGWRQKICRTMEMEVLDNNYVINEL